MSLTACAIARLTAAATHNLALVTLNAADYAHFDGLSVLDWAH